MLKPRNLLNTNENDANRRQMLVDVSPRRAKLTYTREATRMSSEKSRYIKEEKKRSNADDIRVVACEYSLVPAVIFY